MENKEGAPLVMVSRGRPSVHSIRLKCEGGTYRNVCLDFVSKFMLYTGMSVPDLARAAGVTRQTMHRYMSTDDMRLSVAERMVESCGMWLFLGFVPVGTPDDADFDYRRYMKDYRQGDRKRLSFLSAEMARRNVSRRDVAGYIGFGESAVDHLFRQDDIYFSRLMVIAHGMGLKLHVTISDKYDRDSLCGEPGGVRPVVSLDITGV